MLTIFPWSPSLFPVASSAEMRAIGLAFLRNTPSIKPFCPMLPMFSHSPVPGLAWNWDRYESITSSWVIAGLMPAMPCSVLNCGPYTVLVLYAANSCVGSNGCPKLAGFSPCDSAMANCSLDGTVMTAGAFAIRSRILKNACFCHV